MPSPELDPLLPKNEPSPEIITGNRHSRFATNGKNTNDLRGDSHSYDTYDKSDAVYGSFDQKDPAVGEGLISTTGDQQNDNDDENDGPEPRTFALQSLSAFFVVVVLFACIVTFLLRGELRVPWDRDDDSSPSPIAPHPSHSPSTTSLSPSPSSSSAPSESPIPSRVAAILQRTPLIDGHDDLAIFLRFAYGNDIRSPEFRDKFENGGLEQHVDIPRLREGMVGGAFWSAFVPCPKNASYDFSDGTYASATSQTLEQIDLIRRLSWQYPWLFTPGYLRPSEYVSRFRENKTLVSPLSIEGLHQLPPSAAFSTLRHYRALGVRAATLNWNCHNAFADAALITDNGQTIVAPPTPGRDGLSARGRALIREMNRIGVLVDLSHTGYTTQQAVLGAGDGDDSVSAAPVIYSHSSVFALCPHPRNVHDDMLDRVRATDSLVMINFAPDFVSCLPPPDPMTLPELYEPNNTIAQVVRHVTYVGQRIGYDHVGFGSDFDGIETTPRGLERGVADFPKLVGLLLEAGVSDEDVEKVVGGNLLRVWERAEEVAIKMQEDGVPEGVDEIEPLSLEDLY